jgi:hypothetical protein
LCGGTQTGEGGKEHESEHEERGAHSHHHTWRGPLRATALQG